MAKTKNTGLGRGLEAIFAENSEADNDRVTMLRLSEIEPNPDQPRKDFDPEALAQLADSIATHGLIQPIVVRSTEHEGYYEIVAGERRWRASKMAGLTEVPVIIMELDNARAAQVALIENIQRKALNALEEANAYNALIEEYRMTQEEISRQIGKSRSAVANVLRLLELPEEVAKLVESQALSAGHARALLGLKDMSKITDAAKTIVAKDLSVRAAEALVKSLNAESARAQREEAEKKEAPKVDYTAELAKKMSSRLGRRVKIKNDGKKHSLELEFSDNDDLDSIIKLLCGDNIFDE